MELGNKIRELGLKKSATQEQLDSFTSPRSVSASGKPEFPKVKDTIYPNPRLHDFNLVTEY